MKSSVSILCECIDHIENDLLVAVGTLRNNVDGSDSFETGKYEGLCQALEIISNRLYQLDCIMENKG